MSDSLIQQDNQEITPVIIDVGKASRKKAKQLKKGKGPLAEQVAETIQQFKAQLGEESVQGVLPVILLIEKKPKKKSIFPLL